MAAGALGHGVLKDVQTLEMVHYLQLVVILIVLFGKKNGVYLFCSYSKDCKGDKLKMEVLI